MLMQQQRFINQPYDPYINTPFSPQAVDRILQEMVDIVANPPVRQGQRRAIPSAGDRNVRQRPNPPRQPFQFRAQAPNPNAPPAPPQAPPQPFQFQVQVPEVAAAQAPQATSFEKLMHAAYYYDKREMIQKLNKFAATLPSLGIDYRNLSRAQIIKGANLSKEDAEEILSKADLSRMSGVEGLTNDGIPFVHGSNTKIRRGQGDRVVRIRGLYKDVNAVLSKG